MLCPNCNNDMVYVFIHDIVDGVEVPVQKNKCFNCSTIIGDEDTEKGE